MWKGMNVQQCRAESSALEGHIKKLTGIREDLDREVATIDKSWNGDDSVRFVSKWHNSERKQVQDAIEFLKKQLNTLNQEIAEQARVSR